MTDKVDHIQLEKLGEQEDSSTSSLHIDDSLDSDGITSYNQDRSDLLQSSIEEAISSNSVDIVKQWLDSIKDSQPHKVNALTEENKTALHLAVSCNNKKVVLLLCQAGADPSLLDDEKKLPLHIACSLPQDKDVTEVVEILLEKNSPFDVKDEDECTPLYYAASNGHLSTVSTLLDKGADMTMKDDIGDTSVHAAAQNGHSDVLKEMIARNPSCVNLCGYNQETPLHQASEEGHLSAVQTILKAKPDVNAESEDGTTPLGSVAQSGSTQVAKLLVENGALVNPQLQQENSFRTPFHKAAYYGYPELALYLLGKGATVSAWAFQEIVDEGYEEIAAAVVKSSQWPVALRRTYADRGHETTPFRELIRKMPDVAEVVLNQCAVENPDVQEHGDEFYSVVYNYEFIEDFKDGTNTRIDETDGSKKKSKQKDTYGCSHNEVLSRSRDCYFNWGPSKFSSFHHPLAIMVRKKRLNLLSHPVIGSLLHYKWKAFGQYGYFVNLLTYCVFLIFLTAFALVVPNPQSSFCIDNSSVASTLVLCGGMNVSSRNFLYLAPAVVIIFALCRLVLEFSQLISLKLSYVTDWVNWMEVILFVCSIIFVWVYTTDCQCVLPWQWQVGVIAVFLGWIDLVIFISKFPLTGIYVLMFVRILYTFLKMLVLTLLLVIAFGITFYMVFFDPLAKRSPFSDPPRSLLKTMTMTTGELGFEDIFRLDYSTDPEQVDDIEYLPISVILWIVFIVLMPVLLTNMLVGLAVGDIEAIQNEAHLQKLALQVEQVLAIEELLPQFLRKKFRITYKEVFPNKQRSKFAKIVTKVGFMIWGGDRYDSQESIAKVLHPPSDLTEDILEKTNSLVQDVEEIKQALHKYQDLRCLLEEIAKKHGIDVVEN